MDINAGFIFNETSSTRNNNVSRESIKKENESSYLYGYNNITNESNVDVTGGVNSVTIYLMDNSFFTFNLLRKGPLTGAQILFELSLYVGGDYKHISEMFSLWMISPLLEMPLGSEDKPSEVRDKWEMLLKKYSWKYKKYPKKDVPCLVIKRNYLMEKEKEKEILNFYQEKGYNELYSFFTKILFMDARDEYLRGRYLVDEDDENTLTEMLVSLSEYEVGSEKINEGFLKEINRSLRPKHHTSYHSFIHEVSFKLKEVFNETNTSINSILYKKFDSPITIMTAFLEKVRIYNTYGSIFYKGYLSDKAIKNLKGPYKENFISKIISHLQTTYRQIIVWINHSTFGIYESKNFNIIYRTSINSIRWTISPEMEGYIQSFYLFHDNGSSNFTEIAGENAFLIHIALTILTTHNNNNSNRMIH
uniref:FERM domain-containing protein n=1 Tax=Parastrongyloides trichosuri TaxID=131310 RepID=A0A0N4Z0T7_PARTI